MNDLQRSVLLLALASAAPGCASDRPGSAGSTNGGSANGGNGSANGGNGSVLDSGTNPPGSSMVDAGATEAPGSVYALQATVFNPDDTATSYIVLSDTVDLDGEISLDGAREFPGRVVIEAANGKLFIASEGEPRITSHSISDDFEWSDDDNELSLVNLGTPYVTFDTLVNEHAAYTRLDEIGTARVVWDPAELSIVGTRENAGIPAESGGVPLTWGAGAGFDFGGTPFWTFTYSDDDYFDRGESTFLAVYDPVTHEEERVIELDCPSTGTPSKDEQGNIYLSNWDYWPTRALYGLGAPSCVKRLKPDVTLDTDWNPDFLEWTGGRHLMAWYYLRNGKAIGNVLHHEQLEALGADFSGEYDPAIYDEIENGEHYRPWLFDLEAETASPIDGFDDILSALQLVTLNDRYFALLPYDNWTRMEVVEVDPDAGTATPHFSVDAYIDGWVKVR